MSSERRKLILLILDGWGYRAESEYNATVLSDPVNYNRLLDKDPWVLMDASEENVGLPKGQMGNSEVGHTNIGAGRIVYQDLLKVTKSFESGEALKNKNFTHFIDKIISTKGRLHLFGLCSDGGVHSHIDHIKDTIKACKELGVKELYLHVITDGRDTPPNSGLGFVNELEDFMKDQGLGIIADVSGRYYAMDRDKRWDRIQKAYNVIRFGKSEKESNSAAEAVKASYDAGKTDEFIEPVHIKGVNGEIKDGDGLFFINFRADRVRQMLKVFYDESFKEFDRGSKPKVELLTMTEYDSSMPVPIMFESQPLKHILGEVLSDAGIKQLRIAETEKYAHVTYFFNGGEEKVFNGEERILVPSPRDVATYDLKPEMSVKEVEAKFEEHFLKDDIGVVIMNFANPDMVGHSGILEAAIAACKFVDSMLGKVIEVADKTNSILLVTADHGNCETMWDYEHNMPCTSHTTVPVRFIVHNYPCKFNTARAKLADIAPTILKMLNLPIPAEMTGNVIIE